MLKDSSLGGWGR